MTGLEEAENFYRKLGAPMLERDFAECANRVAVGLVGHGSECFGFDDEISRDHDFEPRFYLWLTKEDEEKYGFALTRAYDKIRAEYCGDKRARTSVGAANYGGVMTIGDFYRRYTGEEGAPSSLKGWLYTDSEFFAEATNGRVFADPLGEFSRVRDEILHGMPEDVRLKKIASSAMKIAQSGQYNFARCVKRGEMGAAMLALGEFARNALYMAFLLDKRHCPYYKWAFRAMRQLPETGELASPLEYLLTEANDSDTLKVKEGIIEDICGVFATIMRKQNIADCPDNYLEPFAYAIQKNIRNAEIRNMHILLP